GHKTDPRREPWQRTLARLLEESLGGQLFLELLEGELQGSIPVQLQRLDLELIFTTRFVDVDPSARQHRRSVLRFELEESRGRPEADTPQLRLGVFQREIVMAAGGEFRPGDLTGDPNVKKFPVEHAPNRRI